MGERFGHYEIMRRLAAGGMAEVLLAKQTSLGGFERLVCLKRILAHLGSQEEFLRMFMDEARIAANLIHPNIAQIYDISEQAGQYYIAMEYVRGEDLRRVYNQEVGAGRAIPKHIAALITMGAAAGLDYAHRQTNLAGAPLGIVHRDVSPQNIIVTYDGHVKLIDFGVAKAAGKLNQTRAGVLKGKYSYMSPEQASGDPLDGRTDIFALGITLYEITTGTRLFKRDNELETLHAVIACHVKPPSQVVPNYDSDLERIVLRALAYDVDSRYTTAGELEHDLERYLLHRGHPTSATSLASYMQELFAEKLADEALFGGPPWNETATPSRRLSKNAADRQSTQTTQGAHAATTGDHDVGTRVSAPGDDPTVVDGPAPSAQPKSIEASAAADVTSKPGDDGLTPIEWRQLPESPERTAPTHSQSAGAQEISFTLPPQPVPTAEQPQNNIGVAIPARPGFGRAALSVAAVALAVAAWAGSRTWRNQKNQPQPAARIALAPPAPLGNVGGPSADLKPSSSVPTGARSAPAGTPKEAPLGPHDGLLDLDTPVTMAVWLGNRYVGATPLVAEPLPAGTLLLKLVNSRDGGTLMRTVRLKKGARQRLSVGDERGTLDVEAEPWAWVQMGQHPAQETPAHLELYEGEYALTTECPNGERQEHTIRVTASTPSKLSVPCQNP